MQPKRPRYAAEEAAIFSRRGCHMLMQPKRPPYAAEEAAIYDDKVQLKKQPYAFI
jgi:hypothetical protein